MARPTSAPPSDPAESERIEWVPVAEVRRLIAAHEVPDGLSLTALLWWLTIGDAERRRAGRVRAGGHPPALVAQLILLVRTTGRPP